MRLKKVLNPLMWFGKYGVLYDIKWGIIHRTIDRYNKVEIKSLKPGYYDADTRMLHSMFQLLCDYVEIELGYRQYWMDPEDSKDLIDKWSLFKRFYVKLIEKTPLARSFVTLRFPDLGLRYNDFYVNYEDEQMKEYCGDTPEYEEYIERWKHFGREVRVLYMWWTEDRPNRPDPMDLSGWSVLCDKYPLKFEKTEDGEFYKTVDYPPEVEKLKTECSKKTHEIEEKYSKEDEDMMIRLIKVRRGLWT